MSRLTPAATAKNGIYGRRTEKHLEEIVETARLISWLAAFNDLYCDVHYTVCRIGDGQRASKTRLGYYRYCRRFLRSVCIVSPVYPLALLLA